MGELRLRHRARMREKDLKRLNETLMANLGLEKAPLPDSAERAETGLAFEAVLAAGRILAVEFGERGPMLTARGLLATPATRRYVTVDMGAIKFVNNGADVMLPGIVEADPAIAPGDLVWIRDERNLRPLAIGEALVAGSGMPRGPKGKAVKSLHYVGDAIWAFEA